MYPIPSLGEFVTAKLIPPKILISFLPLPSLLNHKLPVKLETVPVDSRFPFRTYLLARAEINLANAPAIPATALRIITANKRFGIQFRVVDPSKSEHVTYTHESKQDLSIEEPNFIQISFFFLFFFLIIKSTSRII